MNRNKHQNRTSKKRLSIWIISLFVCMAIIITSTILWDYFALWAYIKTPKWLMSNATADITTSPSEIVLTNTPTPNPTPTISDSTNLSATITPNPTPTPLLTPIPHPGDRDGKFTNNEIIIQDNIYRSRDLSIEIDRFEENEIVYFVAEVYVRDMDNFYAAFARGIYGQKTLAVSEIAKDNDAIFAVSGDYYNARDGGITIRNSKLYREEKEPSRDTLAIYPDGSMKGFSHKEADAYRFVKDDVVHTYVFGPLLVSDFTIVKNFTEGDKNVRHPRCGIGMIEPYHYLFVLADGRRQGYSIGMTIEELANKFLDLGCDVGYTLDGGGSATMVFMDQLVNMPQGTTKERGVGDAICFIENEIPQNDGG
ncbi:MAG: phosphodiester glycosidase family protein [Clostridiales bacterium]|nr:phosphodiester glycosidase family protein [Clostridiales bacterium]